MLLFTLGLVFGGFFVTFILCSFMINKDED